jgi:ABC transporter substrate binding protein
MLDIGRRQFITLLSGAAAVWPLTAIAQLSPDIRRVGVLANEPWPPLEGLRDGMRALGYVDERGLHVEYRFAEGRAERYPDLAAELVRLRPDVIVAWGTPASLAAKQATGTVPIVMISGDPIAVGLEAAEERDLGRAFLTLSRQRPDAVLIVADPFLTSQRRRVAAFMIENGFRQCTLTARMLWPAVSFPMRRTITTSSPGSDLDRQDPEGHQARRPANSAAD